MLPRELSRLSAPKTSLSLIFFAAIFQTVAAA